MDPLKHIVRYITIPLYDIKDKQNISSILKDVNKSQYLSPEEIQKQQLKKLRSIVDYAFLHTKHYKKELSDCGYSPGDIRSLEDLKKIPLLTKEEIRANCMEMISDEYEIEQLRYKRTGGSTSVPLKLYVDNKAHRYKLAATIRHNEWAGYYRGDKLAAIWGATDRKYSFKEKLRNRIYGRTIFLDTLKLDADYMSDFVNTIQKFKPEILMGHAHSIYIFACFIEESKSKPPAFRAIISTAEMLYDHERAKIESVFGKIVFNRYGCEELSIIASECEQQDGLHINADGLYVEVIDGDETTPGKLIITDLWNRGMPFIRYEIDDMATTRPGLCSCGRNLPRLGKIFGRTTDFLYSPEGKMISGVSILDTFVIHIPGIRQVQIIQNKINELNINVVKDEKFTEHSLETLADNVATIFGPEMKFNVKYIEEISKTMQGKYRFTICNLSLS